MTSLYNIDYLKHLCSKYGLVPSRKYGQNFLINEEPIVAMLEAGDVGKDDAVVEVGPGFGVLTLALAEKVKKLVSFEIEKKLEPYWEKILSCHSERSEESLSQVERTEILRYTQDDKPKCQHDKIEIVWGNVLKQEINLEKYKVVANLPYQITSNVIRKFLEAEEKPELMVLMVQKEVAERICAKPGDMSVLAISVQYYAEPEIIMQVPRSYFWPVPAVDSAVIKITPKKSVCHSERSEESLSQSPNGQRSFVSTQDDKCGGDIRFFKIVKAGFASRRKMLIKNLGAVTDKKTLPAIFKELGINEKVRAQELSVEKWRDLVAKLSF